ncbi:nucleotidyltransferase family protein [Agrobacterium sp. 16-2014-1-2a]
MAAGRSSRMAKGLHKLLIEFDGMPLVRRSAMILAQVQPAASVVVVGHRHAEIEAALSGLPMPVVVNDRYSSGMGTSLALGVSYPEMAGMDGVLIVLADMPALHPSHVRSLVEVFNNAKRQVIVRASSGELPGHPVIIPKPLIDQLKLLDGDTGAQHIIRSSPLPVQMSNIGAAALTDVDTLEDALLAGGNIQTGTMSLSKTLPFPGRR